MKREILVAAVMSVAAHADPPSQYLPRPSLPPYVQPAPTPSPTPAQPGGVIVPIGQGAVLGAGSVPLPGGGSVSGSTVVGPGNNVSVGGSVTLPHDVGGK